MAGINITVDAKGLDRLAIGGRIYDALLFSTDVINLNSVIKGDNGVITIKETDLSGLIQMVNQIPYSMPIRLIKE